MSTFLRPFLDGVSSAVGLVSQAGNGQPQSVGDFLHAPDAASRIVDYFGGNPADAMSNFYDQFPPPSETTANLWIEALSLGTEASTATFTEPLHFLAADYRALSSAKQTSETITDSLTVLLGNQVLLPRGVAKRSAKPVIQAMSARLISSKPADISDDIWRRVTERCSTKWVKIYGLDTEAIEKLKAEHIARLAEVIGARISTLEKMGISRVLLIDIADRFSEEIAGKIIASGGIGSLRNAIKSINPLSHVKRVTGMERIVSEAVEQYSSLDGDDAKSLAGKILDLLSRLRKQIPGDSLRTLVEKLVAVHQYACAFSIYHSDSHVRDNSEEIASRVLSDAYAMLRLSPDAEPYDLAKRLSDEIHESVIAAASFAKNHSDPSIKRLENAAAHAAVRKHRRGKSTGAEIAEETAQSYSLALELASQSELGAQYKKTVAYLVVNRGIKPGDVEGFVSDVLRSAAVIRALAENSDDIEIRRVASYIVAGAIHNGIKTQQSAGQAFEDFSAVYKKVLDYALTHEDPFLQQFATDIAAAMVYGGSRNPDKAILAIQNYVKRISKITEKYRGSVDVKALNALKQKMYRYIIRSEACLKYAAFTAKIVHDLISASEIPELRSMTDLAVHVTFELAIANVSDGLGYSEASSKAIANKIHEIFVRAFELSKNAVDDEIDYVYKVMPPNYSNHSLEELSALIDKRFRYHQSLNSILKNKGDSATLLDREVVGYLLRFQPSDCLQMTDAEIVEAANEKFALVSRAITEIRTYINGLDQKDQSVAAIKLIFDKKDSWYNFHSDGILTGKQFAENLIQTYGIALKALEEAGVSQARSIARHIVLYRFTDPKLAKKEIENVVACVKAMLEVVNADKEITGQASAVIHAIMSHPEYYSPRLIGVATRKYLAAKKAPKDNIPK